MTKRKPILISLLAATGLVGLALSPAFNTQVVNVIWQGDSTPRTTGPLTNAWVQMLVEQAHDNIFLFNPGPAQLAMNEHPYVYHAHVQRDYLARVIDVHIVPRQQTAYVQFGTGSYLRIDREGFVMSTTDQLSESLPVVTGLDFTHFTVGSALQTVHDQAFEVIALFADIFVAFELTSDVVTLDPTDVHNIRLGYGNIVVNLGTPTDLAEKVRIFLSVKDIPEIYFHKSIGGQLNITNIETNWTFNILT